MFQTIRGRRLALALLSALCLGAGEAKPELPKLAVGTVFPMSGPQAAFGKEAMRGIEIATAALATKDPDLGLRLSLMAGDDLSTAKDAQTAATKLLGERSHVLIGSLTAASSAAVAGVARAQQIPVVTPLATQLTLQTGTPIFRACFDEQQQAELLATFALTVLGVKQAATLRDDTLTAQAFTERFAAAFKAGGGEIVAAEVYDLSSDDYSATLKKVEATGAKIVATPAAYQTAAAIMQQSKKLNTKFAFLGGESWDTAELGKQAGNAAAGHYFVSHFAVDDPDPKTKEFVDAFKAKYNRNPGAIAALTYDAYNLVAESFKQANANMKGPMTQALLRTKGFAGATGTLSFGPAGETFKAGIVKQTGASGPAKFKARVELKAPGA